MRKILLCALAVAGGLAIGGAAEGAAGFRPRAQGSAPLPARGSIDLAAMDMSGMKSGGMQMAGSAATSPAGPVVKVGDLTISGAFARAMLPGQPTGGGYFTVANAGSVPDTLIAARSPVAGVVSLHEMTMSGNVMQMRPLPGGIPIPAGGSVSLTPSGLHLMFEKVTTPFKQGASIPLTLSFAHAGTVTLSLPVGSVAATAPGM